MPGLLDMMMDNPFINAIQTHEGWKEGSVSQRNNNPGNLVYAGQPKAQKGEGGFAKFPDYQSGVEALHKQIQLDASRGLSIHDFAKKYAPKESGNDPEAYAAALASAVGKKIDDPLSSALSSTPATTSKRSLLDEVLDKPDVAPAGMDWVKQKAAEGWERFKDVANRAGEGIGKGFGLPRSLPTSQTDLARMADQGSKFDPSILLGPGGPAIVGGIKNIIEGGKEIGKGNVAGGLGEIGATAATPFLGKLGGGEAEETSSGRPSFTPEEPPVNPNLDRATSKIVKASQPPDIAVPKVKEAMKTYIPNLKAQEASIGKPINLDSHPEAQAALETDLKRQFDSYKDPAEIQGFKADGNIIADHYMASLDPDMKLDHPAEYQGHKEFSDTWRHPMDMDELYNKYQGAYSRAKAFWNGSPDAQTAALLAKSSVMQDIAQYNGAKEALFKTIDPDNNGNVVAQIQHQRSDAITGRQMMEKIQATRDKQVQPSGVQQALGVASGLAGGAAGIDLMAQGNPLGVVPLAGGVYGAYKAIKPPTDLNAMIGDAFKNFKGEKPSDLTNPKATGMYPTEPGQFQTQRQLDLGGAFPWDLPENALRLSKPEAGPGYSKQYDLPLGDYPDPRTAPLFTGRPVGVVPRDWDKYLSPPWEFPEHEQPPTEPFGTQQ